MACSNCDFKGYILVPQLVNNIEVKQARQCTNCNDIAAYSAYVRSKYSKLAQEKPQILFENDNYNNVISLYPFQKNSVPKPSPKPDECGLVLDLEEYRKRKKSNS